MTAHALALSPNALAVRPGRPSLASLSVTSGEDWNTQAITFTGVGFTGATSAAIGGVNIGSFLVVNDTTITGTVPSRILTAASEAVSASVTRGTTTTKANAYTYSWSPHSVQMQGLWDFRRGVTQAGTATAIANVGTGGANYNLIPCNAAQAYTSSDASLNNKPSIAMVTGGYKTGTFTALTTAPGFSFAIGVAPAGGGSLYVMLDGETLFLRALFKDSDGNGADGTQYAGNRVGSGVAMVGATLFMSVWNVAASKVYQNTLTPVTGTQLSLTPITGCTVGEGGDRAQGFPYGAAMAMAGICESIPSDATLALFADFATRIYGVTIT